MDSRYAESPHGWSSDFPSFQETPAPYIRDALARFLQIVSPEQLRAWDESIPPLQAEVGQVLRDDEDAVGYSAILEYQLPMEHRRPDVVLLLSGAVLVLELKSKGNVELADVDQASAYARDLRAYHRACEQQNVHPALILMRSAGVLGDRAGVRIVGPDAVSALVIELDDPGRGSPIARAAFLDPDAYRPLPTIVAAARELMETGELRRIKRADSETRPTLDYLADVAREAADTRSRHLVLLSGLPGTGKTLVGLQLAHARFLDELAVQRAGGKPSAPAVYLSGNGPLVQVLQYELREGGGGGAAFVRPVKAYVDRYSRKRDLVPPEHVLIFDEAQRAFDAAQVAETHGVGADGKSEPEHFIEFAERVPDWCVVVGLVGSGQEIHVGEEGGISQWVDAILGAPHPAAWTVHLPPHMAEAFRGLPSVNVDRRLHLTAELRYHLADEVHAYVQSVLGESGEPSATVASRLETNGFHVRITRELDVAKRYLKHRYADDPDARFGMVASSRDKSLKQFGVPNDFQSTKQLRYGPWFGEGDDDPLGRSCRTLRTCVTEFGCQGLELNAVILAWGTDFLREGGTWTNRLAKRYAKPESVRDALRLRRNAYRVLLTRARDATVVFVPPLPILDETYTYLVAAGMRELETDQSEEWLPA
jgi:DNA polymerase III delta prime subunit